MIREDNVLLLEKHDDTFEVIEENNTPLKVKGLRMFKVIEPINGEFNIIFQHDPTKVNQDVSNLVDKKGYYMASVDIDEYKNFIWTCFSLGEFHKDENNEYSVISIDEKPRRCTEDEIEILNKIFPEYYEHAFA